MNLVRWTDDRLDDLHGTVKANDHRLDTVQDMSQSNDRRITDLEKAQANTVNVSINNKILLATWASPIVTLIIALLAFFVK